MSGDDTPRERDHVTDGERHEHHKTYPPGAMVIAESGPAMPRNQFEMELQGRVKSLEDSRSFWKWIAGLGIPILFAAAGAVLHDSMAEVAKNSERVGATAARIEALEKAIASDRSSMDRLIEMLEQDIRELRKHAGLDPKPISVVNAP